MQDWNYVYLGNFEITLELSSIKYPLQTDLGYFWDHNKDSMINYMSFVHRGVKGIIYIVVS